MRVAFACGVRRHAPFDRRQELPRDGKAARDFEAHRRKSARLGLSPPGIFPVRADLMCLLAKRKLAAQKEVVPAEPALALGPDTVLGFARVAGQGRR